MNHKDLNTLKVIIEEVVRMDVQTKKSLLWDAFEELKNSWSVDERLLEKLDEKEEETVNGLPASRAEKLMEIKDKYQLDDIDFLFIVGAAVGYYQGQKNVKEVLNRKINTVNEFISSIISKSKL
jgi:CBS domain containing-hemolysin-like protein